MSQFPDAIYTPRETENLPGITYNPANKKSLYSEDFQNLGAEINAIETALGTNLENVVSETVDFSASLNPVGWATSGLTKRAVYTKIGKLVTVEILVSGTSNSAIARISLPFAPSTTITLVVPVRIVNNNSIALGNVAINGGTLLANFGASISGTNNFTGSNSKSVMLLFSYHTS